MGLVRKRDMRKAVKPGQEPEEQPVRLSRTQKKNAALSLQDLGKQLVKLSNELLDEMELPENILDAVKMAKTIKKHTPRDRQMQYIGTLMRKHDPAPIKEFLDALEQGQRKTRGSGKTKVDVKA